MPDENLLLVEAREICRTSLIWDALVAWIPGCDEALKSEALPQFKNAGLGYASITLGGDFGDLADTMQYIATQTAYISRRTDVAKMASSVDDILAARAGGKVAVGINFQGSNVIINELDMISLYHKLGVNQMILAYNIRNAVGDGCQELSDAGLSRFGRLVVAEMNRVGMFVDCSHTGYRSSMEATDISEVPIIYSHSNALALRDHPRNIRDDQIKACAARGGIIGVNGWGPVLAEESEHSLSKLADQIDYISGLAGPEHVGLGLDYSFDEDVVVKRIRGNSRRWPDQKKFGYDVSMFKQIGHGDLPDLVSLLLKKGFKPSEVKGILGENFMRLAKKVWKPS